MAYIGIGANLGNRILGVLEGVLSLARLGELLDVSSVYITEPVGPPQREFLNAVALLRTPLEPLELLRGLKEAEAAAGRGPGPRWGPRVLDLDIIAYQGVEMDTPELTLPHPRAHARNFVLVPWGELAGRWPGLGYRGGEGEGRVELLLEREALLWLIGRRFPG